MGIVSAQLLKDVDGSWAFPSEHSYRTSWQVFTDDAGATAYDVLSASNCPVKLGDVYAGWTEAGGVYSPKTTPDDPDAVCVYVNPRKDPRHLFRWTLDCRYEGIDDPTAEPPAVKDEPVPYQQATILDVNGLAVTNAALDPYEEGMTVDRTRRRLTITRNLPFDAWNPVLASTFENTLNLKPYTYSDMVWVVGVLPPVPIQEAPGHMKLYSLTAERMVRRKLATTIPFTTGFASKDRYFWRMTAVIETDKSTFVDNNGLEQFTRWRQVNINAGYRYRTNLGKLVRFVDVSAHAGGMRLLDLLGRELKTDFDWPDALAALLGPVADPSGGIGPVPNHDFYATQKAVKLTVTAPGVLANDLRATNTNGTYGTPVVTSGPANGALALAADGSFVYTPTGSFTGWDWFQYQVTTDAGLSQPATVAVLVGPRPLVRVFDKYPAKNWDDIASWIGGW